MKTTLTLAAAFAFALTLAPAHPAMAAYEAAGASNAPIAKQPASATKKAEPFKMAKMRGKEARARSGQP
jgi:hypothetical protein